MQYFPFRGRALRSGDQLLLAILLVNVFYIAFKVSTSSTDTGDDSTNTEVKNLTHLSQGFDFSETGPRELSKDPDTTVSDLCPQDPPMLIGDLACDCDPTNVEFLRETFHQVERGRLKPQGCTPRERTAIIIPFRDRLDHLYTLLKMLLPVLMRQQVDATFFIVEQTEPAPFNRAALLNVGYLEAQKVGHFDCFIFHDVDLVPLNDRHLYRCRHQPFHLAASIRFSRWVSTSVMPETYVGGVIALKPQHYELVNGHSNLYFGDASDDLFQRMTNKNLTSTRGGPGGGIYHMLFHEMSETVEPSPEREEILKSAKRRQDVEGLNTSKYKVVEVRTEQFYNWVKVSFDMAEVFRTAPAYTLRDLRRALLKNKTR